MAVLKYKNGSGQYVPISNYTVQPIDPVQTTGSSTTAIMSQNAVTVALNAKANSADVYTQTEANNLIFGQSTVPSGTGAATNVQQLINKTVYGTTTPSPAQTSASVVTTENLATTLSGYATTNAIADFFDGAEYGDGTLAGNTGKKVIAFKHGSTVKVEVDATPFIKDGMLDSATIGNATISGETVKCLILTFNTDSGKNAINIPINDIFNADNYVAKADVDTIVADSISEAVNPDSGSQSAAQKALTDAISDAVAKAIEDALTSGGEVVNQINNTIEEYTYTPQVGSTISLTDVMQNSHTHNNKTVLDGITAAKVTSWDNASSGGVTNVSYDGTIKEITKTVGGNTTSVVSVATLKSDMNLSSTDVGLGNVGNFKAVSTVENQGLTSAEQANARANIGAGTSSFSGNYNDLNGKPSLGDAAAKSVDTSISDSSSSVNLPTSSAVASFVENKGYVTTDTNTTYKLTIGNTTNGDSVNGVNLGTLESKAAAASGTDLSLVTTGEKDVWNNKQDAIVFNTAYNASTNKAATMSDVPAIGTTAGTAFDGAAGATAKAETDFLTGSNGNNTSALTTVASIPVDKRLVRVNLSANGSFSLASLPAAGREIHVIVYASAAITVTIPNTGDYICLNDSTSMSIASGKYGEINVISDGVKGYIRYLGA